jgi:hypothetical protein
MITRTCIGFVKTLKRISKPQLKSLGLYELKQHKPRIDEECLRFLDQRKKLKCSAVEYVIRRVQINQDRMKLNSKHQPLVYADDVNTMDASVHTVKKDSCFSRCQ